MKIFKKVALLTVALATASVGLIGCKSNVKLPVTFVAVTSNTYDDEVTFGDYDYKFKGKVDQKSIKFILEAKVQQRHLNAGGGQGQGGWGNWGGGGNDSAEEDVDPSQVVHVTGITITEKQSNPGGGGGGMPPFGKKLVESSNDGPDGDMPGAPEGVPWRQRHPARRADEGSGLHLPLYLQRLERLHKRYRRYHHHCELHRHGAHVRYVRSVHANTELPRHRHRNVSLHRLYENYQQDRSH